MRKTSTSTQKCEFCDKIRAEFSKASHFNIHVASHKKINCVRTVENCLVARNIYKKHIQKAHMKVKVHDSFLTKTDLEAQKKINSE